jgi:hypothetical protein
MKRLTFSGYNFTKTSTFINLSSLQATSALKKQDQAKRHVLMSMAQLIGTFNSLAMPAEKISTTIPQRVIRATKDSTSQI